MDRKGRKAARGSRLAQGGVGVKERRKVARGVGARGVPTGWSREPSSSAGSPAKIGAVRRPASTLLALLLSVAALAGCLAGCAGAPAPVVVPAAEPIEVPVVFVPGVTGSKMRDPATGHVAWGNGRALFTPRDGAYELALAVTSDAPDAAHRLEPYEVLDEVRLGPFRKPVYGPFLESLAASGYRRGDLSDPGPADTLFGFPYDWRRSNVESARVLVERLDALRRARGEERLTVDLICQSNGVHVCRYLIRHGGASLEAAEAQAESRFGTSDAGPPEWLRVRHLVLVAGSNGGSLRILREIDRGRTYVPLVGRRMLPETLFTFRSLYEDLPHDPPGEMGRFIDPDGRRLEVDLYDAASWVRYGWSAFDPEVEARLERRRERLGTDPVFGTREERLAYLARSLAAARRFQALLAADPPPGRVPCVHLVGDAYVPTAQRAVLERSGDPGTGGWRTLFTGDRRLRRGSYAYHAATAPGDLHATLPSQLALSPAERERTVGQPFLLAGGHFELILDPASHRRVREALAGECR
jgi:hypothetical protein